MTAGVGSVGANWAADTGAFNVPIPFTAYIPNVLNRIYVSLAFIFVPPTMDARRDAGKPSETRVDEEICF